MYSFITIPIGLGIALGIFVAGCIITWRVARHFFPDRKRPTIAGGSTLVLTVVIVLVTYLIQPKPCTQGLPNPSKGPPSCVTGQITLDGSTALYPFAKAVAERYMQQCSGSMITVQKSSSLEGLKKLGNNTVTIANSDVLAPTHMTGLEDHEVIIAVFVVIVNTKVNISNLTSSQLQEIYNGTVTNWKDVGGPNMPIVAYRRAEGSGTRYTFDQYILPQHTERITHPDTLDDTQALVTSVQNTVGAIGYASYDDVYTYAPSVASSLIIAIDGTRLGRQFYIDIADNTYKFWSIEHMYTAGPAVGLAKAFINYMGSDQVRAIANAHSFVDINTVSPDALAAHCSQ